MRRRPPRSTRTDTLFPYTTLFRSLNWASEGVGATAAALVDLSTVAGNKISNPPWVKFQSAGWVNFPSAPTARLQNHRRSEEHTSELQSLMRISYAVFCLKQTNKQPYTCSERSTKT